MVAGPRPGIDATRKGEAFLVGRERFIERFQEFAPPHRDQEFFETGVSSGVIVLDGNFVPCRPDLRVTRVRQAEGCIQVCQLPGIENLR